MNTMTRLLLTLSALLLALTWTPPIVARDTVQDDTAVVDEVAEAFAPLRKRFNLLRQSLQAQNGMAERDKPLLRSLQSDVQSFLAANPDYKPAIAVHAQLSIWLDDYEAVFNAFEKLVTLDPDNVQLAVDWEAYFTQLEDESWADRVRQRLRELRPNDVGLAKRLADRYKDRSEYEAVVEVLTSVDLDPVEDARYLQLLSTAYSALHMFEEALAAANSVSEEAFAADPRLRIEIQGAAKDWEEAIALWEEEQQIRAAEASADDLPRAEIVTSKGSIIVELFENEAPNTVANFIKLASKDFWPGTLFHRVEPGLLIQGGDPFSRPGEPRLAGTGNPGYYIPDEHHGDNARHHFTGSLGMGKRKLEDTAGCQFYILTRPAPWLDGRHTVFGRVLKGMDVVRNIEVDDEILEVKVLRKRDHEYTVDTLPLDDVGASQAATQEGGSGDQVDDGANASDDDENKDG